MSDEASAAERPANVIVVGGGVAGLVAARDLARAGVRVTVLESSERFGGQLQRHTVGGIELDAGAEAFATRGGTVQALAEELGLADAVVAPSDAGAWLQRSSGDAVPLPATSILGIPGTPLASDVIRVIGWWSALRAFADALLPSVVGAKKTTLGEFVRVRMGRAVVDELVAPVARGVHSAQPDELELDRVAPGVRIALLREGSLARGVRDLRAKAPAGSAVLGLRGGVARLVDELVADLRLAGATLRTRAHVESVGPDVVVVDGERMPGRVLVAAAGFTGDDAATPTTVTVVTLVVQQSALDTAPRGTGVLVAQGAPGVRARALTHVTAKWPWLAERAGGRHVLRLSYDRVGDDWREVARADAAVLLGVELPTGAVIDAARVEWTRRGAADALDGVAGVGEWTAGTGLAAVVRQAREQAGRMLHGPDVP
ncbi:oxygen-dependent protoporphyrinogen oxidase [Diaminobutyricimonas aerilata]|uniref:Oxygen-dependent protoporphyrinogen oxidase n=1 Tax=Diaminobutyricimonas aerilata TaxID=1162967 RepID=A0A2M9CF29_9MICO|nr:FAD-dependent oxidoreductase [Diaminobutyricimonas aerilata]PJJ70541.1 oxygen-dependent protoporphyrinogen oxidase [Diaminobutyricimonas aerilata]